MLQNQVHQNQKIALDYFFKIISIKPDITPNGLVERINPSLSRFKEIVRFDLSKKELADRPIFFN